MALLAAGVNPFTPLWDDGINVTPATVAFKRGPENVAIAMLDRFQVPAYPPPAWMLEYAADAGFELSQRSHAAWSDSII